MGGVKKKNASWFPQGEKLQGGGVGDHSQRKQRMVETDGEKKRDERGEKQKEAPFARTWRNKKRRVWPEKGVTK